LGAPFRLAKEQVWLFDDRGVGSDRPRDTLPDWITVKSGEDLRWRCIFHTARPLDPRNGLLQTTGAAFQIDAHCGPAPVQAKAYTPIPDHPWRSLLPHSSSRYRDNPTKKERSTDPEYAAIEIIARAGRCRVDVDQLRNGDAERDARAIAEIIDRVLTPPKVR
jgi:hypothetical protein